MAQSTFTRTTTYPSGDVLVDPDLLHAEGEDWGYFVRGMFRNAPLFKASAYLFNADRLMVVGSSGKVYQYDRGV